MDVQYITESSGLGGAEMFLLHLVRESIERGNHTSIALGFRRENEGLRSRAQRLGADVVDLPYVRGNYALNLARAYQFLRPRRDAFLHFSLPHTDSCRWTLLAAARMGMRYVITEHCVPADPLRAGWYFAGTHLLFNPLKRQSYDSARVVVAVSESQRQTLVSRYGMPEGKLKVIRNGVDVESYSCARGEDAAAKDALGIPREALVVGYIGRLVPDKGLEHLIAAFGQIHAALPSCTLLLVGDGALRSQLEDEIASRGLGASVRLAGFRADIPALLCATDVFVLPSSKEGLPISIMEAMAAGKAVIATKVGGIPELVDHGTTGMLVPPGNVPALATAVRTLLQDEALRIEMGKNAREKARRNFSVSRVVEQYFAHYS